MEIINVIVIKDNVVNDIESFEVYDTDLSDEEFEVAEKLEVESVQKGESYFREKCVELGAKEVDIDAYLEDGCYVGGNFLRGRSFYPIPNLFSGCLTYAGF